MGKHRVTRALPPDGEEDEGNGWASVSGEELQWLPYEQDEEVQIWLGEAIPPIVKWLQTKSGTEDKLTKNVLVDHFESIYCWTNNIYSAICLVAHWPRVITCIFFFLNAWDTKNLFNK